MADRLDDVAKNSVNEVVAEISESLNGRMSNWDAKMQSHWRTFEKKWEEHIVQVEPGSKESAITLAEYRIRSSVQADMEKLWTERMEKEDKIMLNKYETLNSTVDPLGSEIINFQVLLTNILQRHWEWQEDRRTDLEPGCYRYNTAFVASLDVPPCVLLVVFPNACVFVDGILI